MGKLGLIVLMVFGILSRGSNWQEAWSKLEEVNFYMEENDPRVIGEFANEENALFLEAYPEDKTLHRNIMSMKVHAYPEQAVTPLEGGQTIYVIVQDQRLAPIQGTQISLVIRMPSGEEDRIIVPALTDKNGVTQFSFSYTTSRTGIVEIKVFAVHEKLHANTSTFFWLWW